MQKANIKNLEMDKYIITFPLQRHLTFQKYLFFVFVLFVLVVIASQQVDLEIDKYFVISFLLHTISFQFLVFSKKLFFYVCFVLFDCDIHLRKFKKL